MPGLIVLLAMLCGCASPRQPAADVPQGSIPAEDRPEPLPKGMKPLTVEQEEMIQQ
ncbi:MAG: hypothetical protein KF914_14705 [Rhizobiaceae bacterium]|nr:hypothetical protein [Rhizobiaceae bacterium]